MKVEEILKDLINLSTCKNIEYRVDKNRLRPIDADLQIPNTSKFTNLTGWVPEIPYEKTINDLLNYWREKVRTYGNSFLKR